MNWQYILEPTHASLGPMALQVVLLGLLLIVFGIALVVLPKEFAGLLANLRNRRSTAEQKEAGLEERQLLLKPHPFEHRERAKMEALLNVGYAFLSPAGKRTSWLGITCILVSLFAFGTYSLHLLLPNSALILAASWSNTASTAPFSSSSGPSSPAKTTWPGVSGASQALVRLGQLDAVQYASSQEYDMWAYSACSAAAMTEIFNVYGHHYRITDILNVEAKLREITPAFGLVEPTGIDRTAAQFGFKAIWLRTLSLNDLITYANRGTPVIISFPPDRWSGGHILVARGGNSTYVYLADTSRLNMQSMLHQTFLKYWGGFAVAVVPNNT